jgi:hypothetical protein
VRRLVSCPREAVLTRERSGYSRMMFLVFKRSGEKTQFRFMPGCLVFSIVASIVLTILLNLLIRAC